MPPVAMTKMPITFPGTKGSRSSNTGTCIISARRTHTKGAIPCASPFPRTFTDPTECATKPCHAEAAPAFSKTRKGTGGAVTSGMTPSLRSRRKSVSSESDSIRPEGFIRQGNSHSFPKKPVGPGKKPGGSTGNPSQGNKPDETGKTQSVGLRFSFGAIRRIVPVFSPVMK